MGNGATTLFGLLGVAVQRIERVAAEGDELVRVVHVVTARRAAGSGFYLPVSNRA